MRPIQYREYPAHRRFGVELELSNNRTKQEIGSGLNQYEEIYGRNKTVKVTPGAEGWAQTKSNAYWHVKFDRTCGPVGYGTDSGWEVASYIGHGADDVLHISRAARFLKVIGCETNLNCGLHIHAETSDFTPRKMGILLARWLKVEPWLIQICHHTRRENIYCQSIRHRMNVKHVEYDPMDPEEFWEDMKPNDLGIHNNYEKRFTINTVGFATSRVIPEYNRNTVEIRLPECLLEEQHVKNWTRLFLNFVEVAQQQERGPESIEPANSVAESLYYLGLQGKEKFVVLDRELLGAKIWFLQITAAKSKSSTSVRRAQKHLEFISRI